MKLFSYLIVYKETSYGKGAISLAIIFRLLIIALIIFAFYKLVRYILDPKRKLDEAHEQGQYYFYDDANDVRKNFFITYKGAKFEGEKYLGTTDQAFDVVSIFVSVIDSMRLQGLTKEDFHFLQNEIRMNYPNAKISWAKPIEELLQK